MNNKTYKWSDTKKLMQYGLDNYRYKDMKAKTEFEPVKVRGGIPESENLRDEAEVNVMVEGVENMGDPVLMKEGEDIRIRADLIEEFEAPVQKGKEVGKISYYLNGELFREYKVVAAENVEKITIGYFMPPVVTYDWASRQMECSVPSRRWMSINPNIMYSLALPE